MENHKELGRYCEELAASYLVSKGYEIVATNYQIQKGEIDIICKRGELLVFAEVKHIGKTGLESLSKSVDLNKRNKILYVAKCFLYEHKEYRNSIIRFDVFGIDADKKRVEHIENAFGENALL